MGLAEQELAEKLAIAVRGLIGALSAYDGLVRQSARHALVEVGEPAVGALIDALDDPITTVRWEAAKALDQIGTADVAPGLVSALNDRDFEVRWIAAGGLARLGAVGLPPLLEALASGPVSEPLREGAHHVLRLLADSELAPVVAPVLASLANASDSSETAASASAALASLSNAGD